MRTKRSVWMRVLMLCVLLGFSTTQADAQFRDILNKVVSKVTGADKVTEANLIGTWTFSGTGIEMKSKSDNAVLNTLTETAASSTIEKKLDEYLGKVGIAAGQFSITFNEDKSFTAATSSGKKTKGTYAIADDQKSVNLKVSKISINCQTDLTSSDLKLMVTADKLLSLASTLTSVASSNTTMQVINKMLSSYKGMDAGMKFTKAKQ